MKIRFSLLFLLPFISMIAQNNIEIKETYTPKWRMNLSGGMGYLLAGTDDAVNTMTAMGINRQDAKDYYKSLKLGVQGSAELHYLLKKNWGLGVCYHLFSTKNSIAPIDLNLFSEFGYLYSINNATYSEKMYINYVGPSFFARQQLDSKEKWQLISSISFGYAHYRDESFIESDTRYIPSLITGSAFGATYDLGLEYFISPNFAIGMNAGIFYSSFGKLKIKNELSSMSMNLDNEENISRFDLSIGIRFYK